MKTSTDDVNMNLLRHKSLMAVWLVTFSVLSSCHAYRNFMAKVPLGFYFSRYTDWMHFIALVFIFFVPDVISFVLYLLLVLTHVENQEEEEGSIGIDNEYFHGIYMGPEARDSANPVDADLSQPAFSIESGVFQDLPGLPGSCSDDQDAHTDSRLARATHEQALSDTEIERVPSVSEIIVLEEVSLDSAPTPLTPPHPAAEPNAVPQPHDQPHEEQEQPHNAIKECGIRALKAYLFISYADLVVFPITVLLLPQGLVKMILLTVLLIFGIFWFPTLMILYNVEKLRTISRSALDCAINWQGFSCHQH